MAWNHRVLANKISDDCTLFSIHEVHYDTNGKPRSYTSEAIDVTSYTPKDLKWILKQMRKCLKEPILWSGEKFPKKYKKK
jgi:hypothetical protein